MTATSYQQLLEQKAALEKQKVELERQLKEAHHEERAGVIAKIMSLLAEHGLSVADLGVDKTKTKSANAGRKVAVKFRNSSTGETWTGRGLKPKWIQAAIASGKNVEDFAV